MLSLRDAGVIPSDFRRGARAAVPDGFGGLTPVCFPTLASLTTSEEAHMESINHAAVPRGTRANLWARKRPSKSAISLGDHDA